MLLAVRISTYGCTWEVWRSFKKLELLSAIASSNSCASFVLSKIKLPACIHLTNRFHVAVHLSSNRPQMTSKCGKDKNVAHEAIAECVTDVLTTF